MRIYSATFAFLFIYCPVRTIEVYASIVSSQAFDYFRLNSGVRVIIYLFVTD